MARKSKEYDDDVDELEEEDDSPPKPPAPKPTSVDPRVRMAQLQEDYRALAGDPSAIPQRLKIASEMRALRDVAVAKEPLVDVRIPRLPVGHTAVIVGDRVYRPGMHRVRASVAEMITWIVNQCEIAERRRMTARSPIEFNAHDPESRIRAVLAEDLPQ